MTGSLAYRKNESAILRGDVPEKYTRILPYIPGKRILEIGSAEGVLALLMAREGMKVTALEKSFERFNAALGLSAAWKLKFPLKRGGSISFVNGPVQEAIGLVEPNTFDTLVAVRMIYYLRDQLDPVFAAVAERIPNVVLCGNGNRASRYRKGYADEEGGPVGFYASAEGMRALLERHGYTVTAELLEGDEIVVGRK